MLGHMLATLGQCLRVRLGHTQAHNQARFLILLNGCAEWFAQSSPPDEQISEKHGNCQQVDDSENYSMCHD